MRVDTGARERNTKRRAGTYRPIILATHRWIGLGSSLVLAIVGSSGIVLVAPGLPLSRFAGPLHERLALGSAGSWVVTLASVSAVLLEFGGLSLWWKRKVLLIRFSTGWRRAFVDLHHSVGAVGLVMMLLLAMSGIGMAFTTPERQPALRRIVFALHTARSFPAPVKMLYVAGTLGFLVQGVTGVVMWSGVASVRRMELTEDGRCGR